MTTTKTWTRPEINALLRSNPKAVERAMLALFARQTADEQAVDAPRHNNGRGFNAPSARRGGYYARWVRSGRSLSGPHLDKALSIALRHSAQLVEEANRPKAAVAPSAA